MNIDPGQTEKARRFLVDFRGADPERLKFETRNLYDLGSETRRFDEIICFETLEHIRRDAEVCAHFRRLLKPGGWLHLCCPHRLHPRHQREVLDTAEQGGHVRAGYTEAEYRALLEPLGFTIDRIAGVGPPGVYRADAVLRFIRNRMGDVAALPLFPLAMPAVWLASDKPAVPFSLYCRATVPATGNGAGS